MLSVLNDVMDISRIESGSMEIDSECFNLNDLLDELCHFFNLEATQQGIQLSCYKSLTSERATICSDKTKLSSVLTNLIKNALKYTDEGQVEVGYRLGKEGCLEFYVKDTGQGIPEDKLSASQECLCYS